jgi:hypothetical protein
MDGYLEELMDDPEYERLCHKEDEDSSEDEE